MNNQLILPYSTAKPLIKEGDVLLFRGRGLVSFLIQKFNMSPYSHVGVASWHNFKSGSLDGILECVEFREWKGGRTIVLDRYIQNMPNIIDVYRPVPFFSAVKMDKELKTYTVRKRFNGRLVTRTMRMMTGLPYGWPRIWWLVKYNLPLFKLFYSYKDFTNDALKDVIYPVCSTAVSYAFNRHRYDLINNKGDNWMQPGDIAQSPRLNYLFTIGEYDLDRQYVQEYTTDRKV